MGRSKAELVPVADQQPAERGIAEAVRLLQYCSEHWGEVTGRGVDNLQYLCGGGLLIQRLPRLGQEPPRFPSR